MVGSLFIESSRLNIGVKMSTVVSGGVVGLCANGTVRICHSVVAEPLLCEKEIWRNNSMAFSMRRDEDRKECVVDRSSQ